MIYKLVCAGVDNFKELYQKDNDEIIIAIDGGYQTLINNDLLVDYYFGDFDSLKNKNIECNNIFEYPAIKDKGDLELCLDYLIYNLKINANDKILIYNATGGRLDHYYAVLNCLKKYSKYNINVLDDKNNIYVKGGNFEILKTKYKYISFFSIEENTVISINGCKYNIDNYKLDVNDNLCLSNEIVEKCDIKVNKNILIIESI